jgi:hypothetical protein
MTDVAAAWPPAPIRIAPKRCFPDRFAGQFGRAAQVLEIDLAESHKAQAHVLPGYQPVDCEQRCGSALLL